MKIKSDRVFNTVFETSLRLLILLDSSGVDLDTETIQAADFMSTYGKKFSIAASSANGDNPFMFCELATRRRLIESSLKELVLKGYALPTASNSGFLYRPLLRGHNLAQSLTSEYSTGYRNAAMSVLTIIETQGINTILATIKNKSGIALDERSTHE